MGPPDGTNKVMSTRLFALAIIVILAAGACSDTGDGAASTTPSPSTTTTVPPATTVTATTSPTTTTTTLPPTPPTAEEAGLRWWNDRVFYEVFVRSFADSDGDGIGDLRGLTERLDYLNDADPNTTDDLGITGIWLMPVFESPSYHGYDVTDYYAIEPDYGTMEDFEAFLDAAHERGIAVIVDMVINHSSSEHPFFQRSRDPDSIFADWYIWSHEDPGYPGPWGTQAWHELDGRYFYGLFWSGMPDFDLENPRVTAQMERVARFWLDDVGVDGFRIDAAKHLIEEGEIQENTDATLEWLEGYQEFTDALNPDSLMVGEVLSGSVVASRYVPDSLDLVFEFELADAMLLSAERGSSSGIGPAMERVLRVYPPGQYATFLTNHDEPRVMNELRTPQRAAVAATLLLTNPGVPFVYYGEEIGMQGPKPDPRIRTPMQWGEEPPGFGFTDATNPWEPFQDDAGDVNVAAQDGVAGSLLEHYRALIHTRNASPALRFGGFVPVESGTGKVYAFVRSVGAEHVLVVVNLSGETVVEYSLSLDEGPLGDVDGVQALIGRAPASPLVTGAGGLADYRPVDELEPYESLVLRLTVDG